MIILSFDELADVITKAFKAKGVEVEVTHGDGKDQMNVAVHTSQRIGKPIFDSVHSSHGHKIGFVINAMYDTPRR